MEAIRKTKKNLPELIFSCPVKYPKYIMDYFEFYSIHFKDVTHRFGTFSSSGYDLSAHIFIQEKSVSTVVLMHGYYDHAGSLKHLIAYLLSKNHNVAVYDMPGHGLSNGYECQIDHFETYGTILQDFIHLCRNNLEGPLHIITHSAGSVSAIDLMLSQKEFLADKVILTAPLVRTRSYTLITKASKPIGFITKKLKRKFNKSSSDPLFYDFLIHDPLQSKSVYLSWVKKLVEWNNKIRKLEPVHNKIFIFQGDQDHTIDMGYNMEFLREKFPFSKSVIIENCRHQMLSEKKEIRDRIFKMVHNHLE